METWFQRIFLSACLGTSLLMASASYAQQQPLKIEPEIERNPVKQAKLDDESFALAVRGGLLSLNDFGSSGLAAAQLSYHINEDFYLGFDYAKAKAGLTSFEKLSGAAPLLTDEQRQWQYYGAQLGYVLLPGEVFLTSNYAMNSAWSIFLGGGNVDFAGDTVFALQAGSQFRVYLTDWIAADLVVADYVFETSVLAEQKSQHSLSLALGVAVYF